MVIGNREALGWILDESRTAFPSAGRSEVAALEPGDELFLYTTRGCFKNPTRDRGRVIGTARALTRAERLELPVRFDEREYPVGAALEIGPLAPFGEGLELAPLVSDLAAFGKSAEAWSVRLRRPLLALSDADAKLLRLQITKPAADQAGARDSYARWYRKGRRSVATDSFRAWGSTHGIKVVDRGPISQEVLEQYERQRGAAGADR